MELHINTVSKVGGMKGRSKVKQKLAYEFKPEDRHLREEATERRILIPPQSQEIL